MKHKSLFSRVIIRYLKFLVLLLLPAFMMNCISSDDESQGNSQTTEKPLPLIEDDTRLTGKTTDTEDITDTEDKQITPQALSPIYTPPKDYEFYLPAAVKTNQPVPVIFIFDPHARGHIAIDLYQQLANDYGFALAASNLSRNGQSIEKGLEIFDQMKNEVSVKIPVDQSQIYTLGFSGGARVAVSIAIQHPEINAVIGCGAGFPEIQQMPQANFNYMALVGYEDFNMNELINNDRMLRRAGFNNQIIIYNGGHDWPAADVMEEAFLAIYLNDMKSGIRKNDAQIIQKATAFYDKKISDYTGRNRYFDAAEMAKRANALLSGLSTPNKFSTLEKSFKTKPEYREDLSAMVNTLERESGLQNNFMAAFDEKAPDWWRNEIGKLKETGSNSYETHLNKRMIGFLGMVSYMLSNAAVAENRFYEAQKNIDVYRLLEPMNPEHAYLNAVLKMKTGEESLAMEYLKQARFLGFNNGDRLNAEPAFDPIRNHPDFLVLLE